MYALPSIALITMPKVPTNLEV